MRSVMVCFHDEGFCLAASRIIRIGSGQIGSSRTAERLNQPELVLVRSFVERLPGMIDAVCNLTKKADGDTPPVPERKE
jgi:hypothetical protein